MTNAMFRIVRAGAMMRAIRAGDKVTIRAPQGQECTGRAVMIGPAGWVLDMGGPHGTPAIADHMNIVRVAHKERRTK